MSRSSSWWFAWCNDLWNIICGILSSVIHTIFITVGWLMWCTASTLVVWWEILVKNYLWCIFMLRWKLRVKSCFTYRGRGLLYFFYKQRLYQNEEMEQGLLMILIFYLNFSIMYILLWAINNNNACCKL